MSKKKVRYLIHVYFHYENKKKLLVDEKIGGNASSSAPPRALREIFEVALFLSLHLREG